VRIFLCFFVSSSTHISIILLVYFAPTNMKRHLIWKNIDCIFFGFNEKMVLACKYGVVARMWYREAAKRLLCDSHCSKMGDSFYSTHKEKSSRGDFKVRKMFL